MPPDWLPEAILGRALHASQDDRLPAIVAAIKGADPEITLQAICDRLENMRERTPRGRTKGQPSSVKMLLKRARFERVTFTSRFCAAGRLCYNSCARQTQTDHFSIKFQHLRKYPAKLVELSTLTQNMSA
jgi:hypothetical protein